MTVESKTTVSIWEVDVVRKGSVIALALVINLAMVFSASAGGDVRRSGSCWENSTWKLKLSPESGRIEVEFEVDQNHNGDTWRVVMKRQGATFFRGSRTTQGPSGSFAVRRVTKDGTGTDRFVARATNPRTEEVCRGTASI
jgi:hypothetical protein